MQYSDTEEKYLRLSLHHTECLEHLRNNKDSFKLILKTLLNGVSKYIKERSK